MMRHTLPLLASLLLVACGDNVNTNPTPTDASTTDTSTGNDASMTGDTSTGNDAVMMGDAAMMGDSARPDASMMTRCGTARPSLASTGSTEGLVIDANGTFYYSQPGGVGRMTADGMRNNAWVRITGASTVWGLALDRTRQRLYVGSPSTHNVHQIDLSSATPQVTDFATTSATGGPNGLTIDAAGNVYFSDFNGSHVYRVTPDGTKTRVTTTTIPGANGLAFRPDGTLLVDSYQRGTVIGLTLTDGMETGRTTVVSGGLGNPDGLALDAMGNIYVTDNSGGRLIRLSPMGTNPEVLMMGLRAPANIEFGAGDLNCNDIYVATGGGLQRFMDNPTVGADVPWHH